MWEDPDEVETLILQIFISLYVQQKHHSDYSVGDNSEDIADNSAMAEGRVMASSEAVIVQINADSHQDPPLTPFFPSRPITTQESYKAHKGEVWSVTHVEVCYSCKELISLIYVDSNMRNICGYWGWGTMVERI